MKPKSSKSLERAALAAQEEANRIQKEARITQDNMERNFAANLEADNVGTVIAGGTADALGIDSTESKKKKRTTSGLASTLGISG